jgi:ATP-dependent protease ClpP protease subunit
VGIGPYSEKGKRLRIRPEFPKNLCLLLGPTESSAPTAKWKAACEFAEGLSNTLHRQEHMNMGEAKKEEQARQELIDLGASTTKTARGTIYTLTIIGQIEGHQALPENIKTTKYEHVIPLLAAVEESEEIDGLLLLLNTVGGDIEAGLAIAELIAGMKKPTVSLVLGGGHSIGIPLAVSAKKSLIVPTASMTVHPVRMTGLVVGAPQTYQYFNQIQEQIVNFVTKNSHISREDFLRYMMATDEIATDVGTVLYGEEAVSSGLMDAIGSLSDALSLLHRQIERRRKREKSHNQ